LFVEAETDELSRAMFTVHSSQTLSALESNSVSEWLASFTTSRNTACSVRTHAPFNRHLHSSMARVVDKRLSGCYTDECTSAVSVDVERRLYKAAIEMGITSITISQRLALTEFHEKELRLGELTDAGWSLHSCEHRGTS
jgi:hypothetical protein